MNSLIKRGLTKLRERRGRCDATLAHHGLTHTFSLSRARLHHHLELAIDRLAKGDCLDAGSGRAPYRRLLATRCSRLTSVDVEDRGSGLDLLADIQNMPEVASQSFDTVLCSQVLEHVPRPWDAISEITRVLRPNGRLLLTVPHLSMLHEVPHDYYRYTEFGLRYLCTRAGLQPESLKPTGGLFCFLGHTASLVWMSTIGTLPGLFWVSWLLNQLLLVKVLGILDRVLGLPALFPCDYLLIARKPPISDEGGEACNGTD